MKLFVWTLVLLGCFSCSRDKDTTYEHGKIKMLVPAGWQIRSEEDLEDGDFSVSIETKELLNTGVIVISWFNDTSLCDTLVLVRSNEMRGEMQTDFKKIYISEPSPWRFDRFTGKEVNYSMTLNNMEGTQGIIDSNVVGNLYSCVSDDLAFLMCYQSGKNDNEKNKKAFERVLKSINQ